MQPARPLWKTVLLRPYGPRRCLHPRGVRGQVEPNRRRCCCRSKRRPTGARLRGPRRPSPGRCPHQGPMVRRRGQSWFPTPPRPEVRAMVAAAGWHQSLPRNARAAWPSVRRAAAGGRSRKGAMQATPKNSSRLASRNLAALAWLARKAALAALGPWDRARATWGAAAARGAAVAVRGAALQVRQGPDSNLLEEMGVGLQPRQAATSAMGIAGSETMASAASCFCRRRLSPTI
mmetsp:Transcript_7887/g.19539  ORF Transcript_7887/g.19539 Transcript_7887/m.19539 type:complete len:233 (-) Transcript_7887:1031-1729(-)